MNIYILGFKFDQNDIRPNEYWLAFKMERPNEVRSLPNFHWKFYLAK